MGEWKIAHVLENIRTIEHVRGGRSLLKLSHYRFKVDLVETIREGGAQIRHYRWRYWRGHTFLAPLAASGGAKLIVGNATLQLEQVPDQSGDFYIRVACERTAEGWQPTYTLQLS